MESFETISHLLQAGILVVLAVWLIIYSIPKMRDDMAKQFNTARDEYLRHNREIDEKHTDRIDQLIQQNHGHVERLIETFQKQLTGQIYNHESARKASHEQILELTKALATITNRTG